MDEDECGSSGLWNIHSHPHPLLLLPQNPHWWSLVRRNRLMNCWQGCKNELMASFLAYFSTPHGHPSNEVPMQPDHYCKRCTTCTCCCCWSCWLLSYIWYLRQQAYQSPILEAHLWTSWVSYHWSHFPLTCSLSGYGPFYHTCDKLYLTWQMTLFHSHYHFHCIGS